MFSPSGRREGVRGEADDAVSDKEPAERVRVLDAPRQQRSEDAEDQDAEELEHRERVSAAVGERAREQELARGDEERGSPRERSGAGLARASRARCPARKIASRRNASGLAATVRTASMPNHQRFPAWSAPDRQQAEREAEGERERRRDDEPRPDDCERPARPARERAPLPADDDRRRPAPRSRSRATASALIPNTAASG